MRCQCLAPRRLTVLMMAPTSPSRIQPHRSRASSLAAPAHAVNPMAMRTSVSSRCAPSVARRFLPQGKRGRVLPHVCHCPARKQRGLYIGHKQRQIGLHKMARPTCRNNFGNRNRSSSARSAGGFSRGGSPLTLRVASCAADFLPRCLMLQHIDRLDIGQYLPLENLDV
jgi:hypothetical protein